MPRLPLTNPTHRRHLEGALAVHFRSYSGIRSWDDAESGINAGWHVVVVDNEGRRFGIKGSGAGVEIDGEAREELISELGALLEVPNACTARRCDDDSLFILGARVHVIVEWLPDAKTIFALTEDEILAIRHDRPEFWAQLGQWMAFCWLCRVRDRHSKNWLWVPTRRQLAGIDMEASLAPTSPYLPEYEWVRVFLASGIDRDTQLGLVKSGMMALLARAEARRPEMLHVVEHARPRIRKLEPPLHGVDSEELFARWLSALGPLP